MTQVALPPSRLALFATFAQIAMFGFGGVLVWSRRMLVEESKWLTPAEFNEAYALCQFLPGPNVINLSVVFGRRIAGVPGSLVALAGLLVPPLIMVSIMALLYACFGEAAPMQHMLRAVAAGTGCAPPGAAFLLVSCPLRLAPAKAQPRRRLREVLFIGIKSKNLAEARRLIT